MNFCAANKKYTWYGASHISEDWNTSSSDIRVKSGTGMLGL